MENKSIASRWSSITAPKKQHINVEEPKSSATTPAAPANPVRHQYRQTILNGLKGESYV